MSRALGTGKRTALDRYKAWLIVVMGACSEESGWYGCVNFRLYVWQLPEWQRGNAHLRIALMHLCISAHTSNVSRSACGLWASIKIGCWAACVVSFGWGGCLDQGKGGAAVTEQPSLPCFINTQLPIRY